MPEEGSQVYPSSKIGLTLAGFFLSGIAFAAPIQPASYDMLNGDGQASGGSFNYWDLSYSGAGNTAVDSSPLSGGLGDLTDGVIPNQNWNAIENVAGTGPYVGWRGKDPVVTFNFAGPVFLSSITIYVDDANGNGGVSTPLSVDIGLNGGPLTNYSITDPAGNAPISVTFNNLNLNGMAIDVRFNRGNEWVFVSEVTFDGRVNPGEIPEPSSWLMAISGLGALLLLGRRR